MLHPRLHPRLHSPRALWLRAGRRGRTDLEDGSHNVCCLVVATGHVAAISSCDPHRGTHADMYSCNLSCSRSDIFSDIFSDILSDIYSGILSGILSDIYSGILSDILSAIFFVAIHLAFFLANGSGPCVLRRGVCHEFVERGSSTWAGTCCKIRIGWFRVTTSWQRRRTRGVKEGRKDGRKEGRRKEGRREWVAPWLKSRDPHLACWGTKRTNLNLLFLLILTTRGCTPSYKWLIITIIPLTSSIYHL